MPLLRTGYFSLTINVLRGSPKIWRVNNRDFFQLDCLGSDQWISSRCFDAEFNSAWALLPCSLPKGLLKRHFSDNYLTTFSESVISEVRNVWRSSFNSRHLKCNLDFKNASKNWEKKFCFSDNSIWIGIVKLPLLRTRYFSSAVNVLTCSPKILHVNKRDFFQLNCLGSDQWISQRCCDADFNRASERLPCCLSKGPLKLDSLDIYLTTFSESVISEVQNLRGSSFDSRYWKFNLDFKNATKNWEKKFCFSDNYIWIGMVKLPLLRTGYFSSAAIVLTRGPRFGIFNMRDFFELNCLSKDQWIS